MRFDRALALMMILLQAVMQAVFYQAYLFSFVAATLAILGAFGFRQLNISRTGQLVITMLLAVVFALRWQYFPAELRYSFVHLAGLGHPLSQFFITLQVSMLFLGMPMGLPLSFPLLGVMAICAMGDMVPTPVHFNVYHALSLGFVVLSATYFGFAGRGVARIQKARSISTAFPYILILVPIIAVSAASSILAKHYQYELDAFLANITPSTLRQFHPGFSKVSRLQSINEIKSLNGGESVALRVFSEETPGYLRAKSYSLMRGSEWISPMHYAPRFPVARPETLGPAQWRGNTFRIAEEGRGSFDTLDVWPAGSFEDVLFTRIHSGYVTASTDMIEVNLDGIVHGPQLNPLSGYSIHGPEHASPVKISESMSTRFTQTPRRMDPRVAELAASLFEGSPSAREKAGRVIEYFLGNYRYKIGIRIPRGVDPVTHFLLEKPAGHCEYFASGAALLLRLGGVPCRYVTGFVAVERNPVGRYWLARNRDAHAWVEAYDEDMGWFIVEATPGDGVPSGGESTRFAYIIDDLKQRLNAIGVALMSGSFKVALGNFGAVLLGVAMLLLTPPIGPILLIGALVGLVSFGILRLIRRSGTSVPAQGPLHPLLEDMDEVILTRGYVREAHETLHRFALRMREEHADDPVFTPVYDWYRRYAELRYGRGDMPSAAARAELKDRFEMIARSFATNRSEVG